MILRSLIHSFIYSFCLFFRVSYSSAYLFFYLFFCLSFCLSFRFLRLCISLFILSFLYSSAYVSLYLSFRLFIPPLMYLFINFLIYPLHSLLLLLLLLSSLLLLLFSYHYHYPIFIPWLNAQQTRHLPTGNNTTDCRHPPIDLKLFSQALKKSMRGCLQSVTADYRHPLIGITRQIIGTLILLTPLKILIFLHWTLRPTFTTLLGKRRAISHWMAVPKNRGKCKLATIEYRRDDVTKNFFWISVFWISCIGGAWWKTSTAHIGWESVHGGPICGRMNT